MDRKAFKRELIRLYANCGSYIMQCGSIEKNGIFITSFEHPTQRKIIEVTESVSEILCVFVYNKNNKCHKRNNIECKTIEQFKRAIA